MELVTQVQIVKEAGCFLPYANALEKGMNQSVLLPALSQ